MYQLRSLILVGLITALLFNLSPSFFGNLFETPIQQVEARYYPYSYYHRYPYYRYYQPYYYYYSYPYYSYCYYASYCQSSGGQLTLKVETNPPGLGVLSGSGTYRRGEAVTIAAPDEIVSSKEEGVRYVFTGWSGAVTGSMKTAKITMTKSMEATANYRKEVYLKVEVEGAPIAASGEGWYREGATATAKTSVDTIKEDRADNRKRYVFEGWTIDGAQKQGNPIAIRMDKSHYAVVKYRTQYKLEVMSSEPRALVAGTQWYDAGATAYISLKRTWIDDHVLGLALIVHKFTYWEGELNGADPASNALTIKMDRPMRVNAVFQTDASRYYGFLVVVFLIALIAASFFVKKVVLSWHRKRRQQPPPQQGPAAPGGGPPQQPPPPPQAGAPPTQQPPPARPAEPPPTQHVQPAPQPLTQGGQPPVPPAIPPQLPPSAPTPPPSLPPSTTPAPPNQVKRESRPPPKETTRPTVRQLQPPIHVTSVRLLPLSKKAAPEQKSD